MSNYAIKLDDNLHIIEIVKKPSPGLAHQQALRYTDEGFRARVIDSDDDEEIELLYRQLLEKRQNGFISDYGHVPNGARKDGDGCRTIGKMILPAFGGKLEGIGAGKGMNASNSDSFASMDKGISSPLTFSSKENGIPEKKLGGFTLNIPHG